ncbi:MAG TPA: hypothetical protein VLG44_02165 [Chlamydiales bacterium]|nr:hypothetical protein [Chlamydiales bacterium]
MAAITKVATVTISSKDEKSPSAYRNPFSGVDSLEKAERVFQSVQRNTAYLRDPSLIQGDPPALFAMKRGDYVLASQYLKWGGVLTLDESHREWILEQPWLLVDYPQLTEQIRNIRWEAAETLQEKKAMLQQALVEYALFGRADEIKWIAERASEHNIALSLVRPLECAIRGNFADVIQALCTTFDVSAVSEKEKKHLVQIAVKMGYPDLLPVLESLEFPISEEQIQRMKDLTSVYEALSSSIRLPRAPSAMADEHHGGYTNKSTAEEEYKWMVSFVFHSLRLGVGIREILDLLHFRRRGMAGRCGLLDLHSFGFPIQPGTNTFTTFRGAYKEYGEKIRAKYRKFPIFVKTAINGVQIPLTEIHKDYWYHTDGTNRDIILDEVAKLCVPLQKCIQEDIRRPIAEVIWLISHAPLSERGTPTILRALVDGLCLFQHRDPTDYRYEVNCDALTYAERQEFVRDFSARVPLKQTLRDHPVYQMEGCLSAITPGFGIL